MEGVKADQVVGEAEKKLRHYESKDRLWPQNLILRVDEFTLQLETPEETSQKRLVTEIPLVRFEINFMVLVKWLKRYQYQRFNSVQPQKI